MILLEWVGNEYIYEYIYIFSITVICKIKTSRVMQKISEEVLEQTFPQKRTFETLLLKITSEGVFLIRIGNAARLNSPALLRFELHCEFVNGMFCTRSLNNVQIIIVAIYFNYN